MYSETVSILAGQERNIGEIVPEGITSVCAKVLTGDAMLNGVQSKFISWVNPNPSVVIVAVTDCTVEVTDQFPIDPPTPPFP